MRSLRPFALSSLLVIPQFEIRNPKSEITMTAYCFLPTAFCLLRSAYCVLPFPFTSSPFALGSLLFLAKPKAQNPKHKDRPLYFLLAS